VEQPGLVLVLSAGPAWREPGPGGGTWVSLPS